MPTLGPVTWGDLLQVIGFGLTILKLHISNIERLAKLETKVDIIMNHVTGESNGS